MAAEGTSTVAATYTAPSNIACIKYWGKRDAATNTPINSSVSVTLNQDDLHAKTTVVAGPALEADRLWLNGTEEDVASNKRVVAVLREIRKRAGTKEGAAGAEAAKAEWKVHIVSANTFPTAAGLASSAAGYACLVAALADVFGVAESYPGELTAIARQGSGSACRSLYGGFVRWEMGEAKDGSDSIAVQVADEKHWPELEVLILVVSDQKKETGSTTGMSTSVATSPLLAHRAAAVVPERLAAIEAAYLARDFDAFGKITMQDSNQFHATCLDTYPPVFYMNDTSRRIVGLVHRLNAASGDGHLKAAYTFDAGPNAVLYVRKEHVAEVLATVLEHYPPPLEGGEGYISSPAVAAAAASVADAVPEALRCSDADRCPGVLRKIYHTTVGDGPRKHGASAALADLATGMPL